MSDPNSSLVEAQKSVEELHSIRDRLAAGRQDYDFLPPALVSHVDDYANEPARLSRYAAGVVPARIMQMMVSAFMRTQYFVDAYLAGMDRLNPYVLFMAARAQVETYAVVWDTIRVVRENAGTSHVRFAERVKKVDDALICATFGTRSERVKGLLAQMPLSRARAVKQTDIDAFNARNILTRLQRLAKSDEYRECEADYERLCEYLHPNIAQNLLLFVPSPVDRRFIRLSRTSGLPMENAIVASARPMNKAASGVLKAFDDLEPPFGSGPEATSRT